MAHILDGACHLEPGIMRRYSWLLISSSPVHMWTAAADSKTKICPFQRRLIRSVPIYYYLLFIIAFSLISLFTVASFDQLLSLTSISKSNLFILFCEEELAMKYRGSNVPSVFINVGRIVCYKKAAANLF